MAKLRHHLKNHFIPHAGNDYQPHALRRHWLNRYAAGLVIFKVLVVGFVAFYAGPAHPSTITPENIIRLSNIARVENKVPALKTNALLTKAAVSKANDMIRQQYFAHISPTNVTPWYWFKQAGYQYSYAGENLAIDFLQSEDVIQAWLNSPSHRRNLLSTRFKDIGVAVASGKINGVESVLVVQMFGTPIPKPVTKVANAPAQTPSVAVAKKQVTPTPVPVVLGQVTTQPPAAPTIITPAADSVVNTSTPTVVGSAEVGSQVDLLIDGQVSGTATTGIDGGYSVKPTAPMSDGQHVITAQAEARNLTSEPSAARSFKVDTTPPTIEEGKTFALFSPVGQDKYDVVVTASGDTANLACACGPLATTSNAGGQAYVGQVTLGPKQNSGGIAVVSSDAAGNEVRTELVDPDLFSTGVVAPADSPTITALRVVFYSRTFMTAFILVMLLLATINVVVHLERQHHPTLIGLLLVIYLAGALLLI